MYNLPCSPVTAKAMDIPPPPPPPPPFQQPTLAVSYWKYAPVGYIPAYISADPAVSGQQSLHWHFPHTHLPDADHKLGQIGSGCWLSIHTWTQVSLRHNDTSYSALVMGEVFPSMATFHSPVAVRITHSILGGSIPNDPASVPPFISACQHLTWGSLLPSLNAGGCRTYPVRFSALACVHLPLPSPAHVQSPFRLTC